MTTVERIESKLPQIERIRAIVGERPEFADRVVAAAERLAARERRTVGQRLMASIRERSAALRDRIRALARARSESQPGLKVPHGLVVALRTLGMAWAALILATMTFAIASRVSARKATAAVEPDADEIRLRTALGPVAFTSRATAFRGGFIDLLYGGGFIDLREATLDPNGALLRVRAVFGGGQIVVPDTWRVTSRVRGIGGVRDVRPAAELPVDAPHLVIEGMALFGGFAVQTELPVEAGALEEAVARASERDLPMTEPVPAV